MMTRRGPVGLLVITIAMAIGISPARAQDESRLLDRTARLHVQGVELAEALRSLQRNAGVALAFSPDLLPAGPVTCSCAEVTVRVALDRLLAGTGLEYRPGRRQILIGRSQPSPSAGEMGLVARDPSPGVQVSGVVVDAESGAGVPDVFVGIDDTDGSALTDTDGRFRIEGVPPGDHTLVFDHVAYGRSSQAVAVEAGVPLAFEVHIAPEAIRLDPLVVEVLSETERRQLTSGFSTSQIEFDEIDLAARQGMRLIDLLTQQMPGVRLRKLPIAPLGSGGNRSISGAGRECIEYRQPSVLAGPTCRNMMVIMDGVPIGNPFDFMPMMELDEIQRIEVLSPGEAGARYGSLAGRGVLLVETRAGRLDETARILPRTTKFYEWSLETEEHDSWHVFRTAFMMNATAVGVSSLGMIHCSEVWEGSLRVRSRCPYAVAMGTGVVGMTLPGVVGGLSARRSGATDLSRGRADWAMSVATFSTWAGYLLLFRGRAQDSPVLQGAGVGVLAFGTPLLLTLSDRLFRSLR